MLDDFSIALASAFRREVETRLGELGWKRQTLAEKADIVPSQLADWFNGQRTIGRDHVNRICWALASGYEDRKREKKEKSKETAKTRREVGVDTLDGMLNALLISAGYAPVTGCRTDLIFTELSAPERDRPRQLRYGWVEYPPFSYSSRGGVKGFAIDIMADIAKLIGVEPFPVKLDWPSLIPTLRAREIDIICPILLELPSRMFQVSFSRVVPKLSIGVAGLVHKDHISNATEYWSPGPKRNLDRLSFNSVRGEAGEALCTMFAPDATVFEQHDGFEEACREISARPFDEKDRIRCLVADDIICQENEHNYPRLKKLESSPVRLPIAAAVHMEEQKLLNVVNACLTILEQTPLYERLRSSEHGKSLEKGGYLKS